MRDLQVEFAWLEREGTAVVREPSGSATWWTFAGLLANEALGAHLQKCGVPAGRADNLLVRLEGGDGQATADQLAKALRGADPAGIVPPVADKAIDNLKFSICLPPDLAISLLQSRMTDMAAIISVLREPVRVVHSSGC